MGTSVTLAPAGGNFIIQRGTHDFKEFIFHYIGLFKKTNSNDKKNINPNFVFLYSKLCS